MKVYISYSNKDKELAVTVASLLRDEKINVWEQTLILPGEEWEETIMQNLDADVFVLLVTENWLNFKWIQEREFQLILGNVAKDSSKIIIPVIPDDSVYKSDNLTSEIRSKVAIISNNPEEIATKLVQAIKKYQGGQVAENIKETEKKQAIEKSAAEYVQETISFIEKREIKLKRAANFWYTTGFLSLIIGIGTVVYLTTFNLFNQDNWISILMWAVKSAAILILLLSASKYSFNLAKSYMSEALRNSDRIHAISFGKFYLQALSSNITAGELKEVFRDWNLDKQVNSFSSLDVNDYDPKLVELIIKIMETAKGNQKM